MIRLLAPLPVTPEAWDAAAAEFPSAIAFNVVDGDHLAVYFDDDDPAVVTESEWQEAVDDAS